MGLFNCNNSQKGKTNLNKIELLVEIANLLVNLGTLILETIKYANI